MLMVHAKRVKKKLETCGGKGVCVCACECVRCEGGMCQVLRPSSHNAGSRGRRKFFLLVAAVAAAAAAAIVVGDVSPRNMPGGGSTEIPQTCSKNNPTYKWCF